MKLLDSNARTIEWPGGAQTPRAVADTSRGADMPDATDFLCPECGRDCVNAGGLGAHVASCQRLCSIDGCVSFVKGRGWCGKHYHRWQRHGDPEAHVGIAKGPDKCCVDGCEAKHHARGFCSTHHGRWSRHGSPDPRPRLTASERFWAKVDVGHPLGCWVWTGAKHPLGYGNFRASPDESVIAHRWAFRELRGYLPAPPLVLDHMCRNTSCVNPDHLEAVTQRENVRRGAAGRYAGNRGDRSGGDV